MLEQGLLQVTGQVGEPASAAQYLLNIVYLHWFSMGVSASSCKLASNVRQLTDF